MLKKNTIINFVSSIVPMLLGVVAVPYLLRHIGIEKFGILTIVWTLIGYFSIFDFGIGRALTQQVAKFKNQHSKLPSLIKSGIFMMSIAGLIGGVILCISVTFFGVEWLKVSPQYMDETRKAILIAALGIPFTTITSGLKGVLEGYEDFLSASTLKMALGISNFIFPIGIVFFVGNSLVLIVLSLVIARFFLMIFHCFPIFKKLSFKEVYSASKIGQIERKETLNFGAWMTLSNIVSPLMVNADRFIISSVLGASVVAYYTVPFDVIVRLLVIPAALTTTLFPRFATLFYGDKVEIIHLYRKSIFFILLGMGTVSLGIILFSYFGLSLWISPDFAKKSWLLTCILALGLLFNSLAQVPYALIQAKGDVKLTSIIHVCEFFLYVPMLIGALKIDGVRGAAIAWTFRVILDYTVLSFFANKKLKNV